MPSNVPQGGSPPPPPQWGNQAAPPPPRWDNQVGGGLAAGGQMRSGGFWIRFVAVLIDAFVLGIPMMVLWGVLLMPKLTTATANGAEMSADEFTSSFLPAILGVGVLMFVLSWLYEAIMMSTKGATLGKMAVGLRVLRSDGTQLSFGRATGRHFAKAIISNIIPFAIAYIMAAFTDRKRALHDMIADTIVVHVR